MRTLAADASELARWAADSGAPGRILRLRRERAGLSRSDLARGRVSPWHGPPPSLAHLAHAWGALELSVVGSVARGEEGPGSDLDVLVRMVTVQLGAATKSASPTCSR